MHVFSSVRVLLCVRPSHQGLTTLDLGCGSGRDVYVMAQLVGSSATVIGIDMTGKEWSSGVRCVVSTEAMPMITRFTL